MTNNSETVREVCAKMMKPSSTCKSCDFVQCPMLAKFSEDVRAAYEREMAAKDAEIEAALKTQNDYHAALLTICTADKTAEGLREIAVDACNGKIAAHNRVANKCRESESASGAKGDK